MSLGKIESDHEHFIRIIMELISYLNDKPGSEEFVKDLKELMKKHL